MPITPADPFHGRHDAAEIILTCVRWHLDLPSSSRPVAQLIRDRGREIHHWCVFRRAPVYSPELDQRCRPSLRRTNKCYRVDETYLKVHGEPQYLYRAMDFTGQTLAFLLTARRAAAAAKRFFRKAFQTPPHPSPRVSNGDQQAAHPGCGQTAESRSNVVEANATAAVPALEQ